MTMSSSVCTDFTPIHPNVAAKVFPKAIKKQCFLHASQIVSVCALKFKLTVCGECAEVRLQHKRPEAARIHPRQVGFLSDSPWSGNACTHEPASIGPPLPLGLSVACCRVPQKTNQTVADGSCTPREVSPGAERSLVMNRCAVKTTTDHNVNI